MRNDNSQISDASGHVPFFICIPARTVLSFSKSLFKFNTGLPDVIQSTSNHFSRRKLIINACRLTMEASYLASPKKALEQFQVSELDGLTDEQVGQARERYGRNGTLAQGSCSNSPNTDCVTALPEDPPTPLWKLVLEQFKDQLVIILLGSAAISFVLALFEDSEDWTPFVDPLVVRIERSC